MASGLVVETSLTGGIPRTMRYASLIRKHEKGLISEDELFEKAVEITARTFSRLSRDLPDYVTDGMYLCDDILNPFIKDLVGVEVGGLVRFFENNFFVRQPIVRERIGLTETPARLLRRIELGERLRRLLRRKLRLPVPGPATFADLALIEPSAPYNSRADLAMDYFARILAPMLELASGRDVILEVHDPSLTRLSKLDGGVLDAYKQALGTLSEREQEKLHLIVYFGSFPRKLAAEAPKRVTLGLDLVESREDIELARELRGRVQLGIIDARSTLMEKIDALRRLVEELSGPESVILSTNTTLEFLPESVAYKKLRLLGRLKRGLESAR